MSKLRWIMKLRSVLVAQALWLIAAGVVALLAVCPAYVYAAKLLHPSLKKQAVSVRLVGRAALVPLSSFGANQEYYVGVLQAKGKKETALVKLIYRFLNYDRDLPATFMNYELVHRFHAIRQPECDAPADTLLYSRRTTALGELLDSNFTFEFAQNATSITIPPASVLPCYVITPSDYQDSTLRPSGSSVPVVAEKQGRESGR